MRHYYRNSIGGENIGIPSHFNAALARNRHHNESIAAALQGINVVQAVTFVPAGRIKMAEDIHGVLGHQLIHLTHLSEIAAYTIHIYNHAFPVLHQKGIKPIQKNVLPHRRQQEFHRNSSFSMFKIYF